MTRLAPWSLREGVVVYGLMINSLALAQQGRGVYCGCELVSKEQAVVDTVTLKAGMLRRWNQELYASYDSDIALPARDATYGRYCTICWDESANTRRIDYGSPISVPGLVQPAEEDIPLWVVYQPPTGKGGLVFYDLRMTPSVDPPGWLVDFSVDDATVYTYYAGGTGARGLWNNSRLSLLTWGVADWSAVQSVYVASTSGGRWNLAAAPYAAFQARFRMTTNGTAWLGLGIGGNAATEVTPHIALRIYRNELYLSNRDATSETNVNLGVAQDDSWHDLTIWRVRTSAGATYRTVLILDGKALGTCDNYVTNAYVLAGAKLEHYDENAVLELDHMKVVSQEES